MIPEFNSRQVEKLSGVFLDVSKGLILAGLAAQTFTQLDFANMLKLLLYGIVLALLGLKLMEK